VNFLLNAEQEQLQQVCREFLGSWATPTPDDASTPASYDTTLWNRIAQELELSGLHIPTSLGGSGAGIEEIGLVLEQIGFAGVSLPYLSTVAMAATALLASGDAQAQALYLPGIADGTVTATLAVPDGGGSWQPSAVSCRAVRTDGAWHLTGRKVNVLDAATADLLLIAAQAGDSPDAGVSLFAVDARAAGMTIVALLALDSSRPIGDIVLDRVPAQLVGEVGQAWTWLARTQRVAMACLAAEQTGGAQRALAMAVEYAKTRTQFDRPIGSFQAIKHRCAEMLVAVEAARSAAYYALWAAGADAPDSATASLTAMIYCSDAFRRVAGDNIQIHGGIGFTWEHAASRLFKRAESARHLFGGPYSYRDELARELSIS
jgi:alkylation response protein AidB-like acyl-CoA dehydrogenase